MPTNQKITVDGTDYAVQDLSEDARAQIGNIRATEQEIARLQVQLGIAETARRSYAAALRKALPVKTGDSKKK